MHHCGVCCREWTVGDESPIFRDPSQADLPLWLLPHKTSNYIMYTNATFCNSAEPISVDCNVPIVWLRCTQGWWQLLCNWLYYSELWILLEIWGLSIDIIQLHPMPRCVKHYILFRIFDSCFMLSDAYFSVLQIYVVGLKRRKTYTTTRCTAMVELIVSRRC